MDRLFLIKLLLSFAIGGAWTILSSTAADKFGSKVGGLITGLPSTALFSLFFLAWTQNPQFAVNATTIIPVIVGVETLFVLSYIYFIKRGLWITLFISFLIWIILAIGLLIIKFDNYILSLAIYALSLIGAYYFLEKFLRIKSAKGKPIVYTPKIIAMRAFLGGIIIAASVFMGKIGGPIVGGMFSGFPAGFLATILITYFAHGATFSAATMKSAIYCEFSLIMYSFMVRNTYVQVGIVWGTLASILVAFLSGYLIYRFFLNRLK